MTGKIRLPYPHPGQAAIRRQAKRFNWLSAGRRWRKTTMVMSIAVESAAQGQRIIWGAPTYDQVRIGFNETRNAAARVGDFNISRMEVAFPGGGVIYFRSLDNPDNVRGYSADGVVMDEAAFTKEEAWYETMRPMLIDTNGWAWFIFTPNGRNWVWQEFQKARDRQDTAYWQVPTLGVKLQDGRLVRDPHPLENPHIPLSEIQAMYETMPEKVFQQEILAQFVEFSGSVFRRIQEAATVDALTAPLPGRQYIAGVDVASSIDYTVICVMDVQDKALVYLDRFNRVDYNVLEDRLAALHKTWRLTSMAVETNSIGQPVIDKLAALGLPIVPFTTTSATKQAIITSLQSAFEHGEIRILNHPALIGELLSFESKRSPSGSYSYSAPAGMHDDTVMALAIAWDALRRPTWSDITDLGVVEDYRSPWA
jgi:phage FluMu gp28-like protein